MAKLLFVCRDQVPLWRPDVASLFGRYLARRGWCTEWHALRLEGQVLPDWLSSESLRAVDYRKGALIGVRRWCAERFRDARAALALALGSFDVAIVRDDYLSLLVVGAIAKIKRIPCAYWMSFLMEDGYVALGRQTKDAKGFLRVVYGWSYGLVGRCLLRMLATSVFAQSEIMARIVAERMGFSRTVVPVHMAVDFELLPEITGPLEGGNLVLGYSGAITLLRGMEDLVRGIALARARGVPVRLLLVGWYETPTDEVTLNALYDSLGLRDAVEFLGRLPVREAHQAVSRCDIGLSPLMSGALYLPSSPTKLFEYLAFGKMVIVGEHPVQREVVEEARAGWVVNQSAEEYAHAIETAYEFKAQGLLAEAADRITNYCFQNHSYERRADVVEGALRMMVKRG